MTPSYQHSWPAESELHNLVSVAQRVLRAQPRMSPGHTRARNRAGHGLEFLDHRAYVPGDALRDIDWRLSARARQPYTRRFEDEASADWVVCLDASQSMLTPGPAKWALASQIAAAFCYLLIDSGCRVSLVVHDDQVVAQLPLGRGRRQYVAIRSQLDSIDLSKRIDRGSNPGCCLPYIPDRAALCVIGDFLAPDFFGVALQRLTARARLPIHLMQLVDRDESVNLEDGALALRDCESHAQRDVFVDEAFRNAADRRLQDVSTRLAAWCRQNGIYYACCDTSTDWLAIMSAHFRALDQRFELAG